MQNLGMNSGFYFILKIWDKASFIDVIQERFVTIREQIERVAMHRRSFDNGAASDRF